jgi:hypothetical protein
MVEIQLAGTVPYTVSERCPANIRAAA